jgi:hypothetical protein
VSHTPGIEEHDFVFGQTAKMTSIAPVSPIFRRIYRPTVVVHSPENDPGRSYAFANPLPASRAIHVPTSLRNRCSMSARRNALRTPPSFFRKTGAGTAMWRIIPPGHAMAASNGRR